MNGGDIPLRYFDKLSYERTFRVKAFGLSLRDVFEGLCELVEGEEIVDLCKVDSNTFNFTLKDEQAVDIISNAGHIRVRDRSFPVVSISKQTVEFRVHWLPSYVKDTFVEDFFSHYGKVTSVTRDAAVFTPNDTKRTGVRRVMMETDELRKRSLPYVINFNGGYTALVTMAGRPPLCLKCRTIGHLRKDCPGSKPSNSGPKTYAQSTGGGHVHSQEHEESQSQEDPTADGTEVTAENGEQGQAGTDGAQGDDSMNSTGSTIPHNGPKRNHDNDDDDLGDSHADGHMLEEDLEGYITMGPNGKKVKV